MKLFTVVLILLLNVSIGLAYDFSYSINDPSSSTADDYIISKSNIEIMNEGAFVYWKQDIGAASLEESEPGTIIYRFDFPKPITQGYLYTRITTFHWSYSKGHSFVYISENGDDWIKLADAAPPPDNGGYNIQSYNDVLPSRLIGTQQVWIKVELNSYGPNASYGGAMTNTAQHLRYEKSRDNTTFRLEVDYNSETNINSDLDAIPVSTVTQTYDYSPVVSPVTGFRPEAIKPISIGAAAKDGPQLDLEVGLNAFDASVDLYLGLHATAIDPNEIFLFTQEGGLIAMSQSGLRPWRQDVTTSIEETLISIPVASLPKGLYTFFLMVTSANQSDPVLLWSSTFNHMTAFFIDQLVSAAEGAVIETSGVRLEILPDSLPTDTEISAYSVPEQDFSNGEKFLGGIRFSPSGVELENMALVEVPISLPEDWDEDERISIYEFYGEDPSLSAWNGYYASMKVVDGQTVAVAPVFHFSGAVFVRNCHSGTFEHLMNQFQSYGCDPHETIEKVKKEYTDFGSITTNVETVKNKDIQMFINSFFTEKYTFNPDDEISQTVVEEMVKNLDQNKLVVLSFHEESWPTKQPNGLYGTFKHTAVLEKKQGRVQIRNSANLSKKTASKLMDAMGGTNLVYIDWDKINEFRELQTGVAVELACGLEPGQLGSEELNPFGIKCYNLLNGKHWSEDLWENLSDRLINAIDGDFSQIKGIPPRPKPWQAVKIYVQEKALDDFCEPVNQESSGPCATQGIVLDEVVDCFEGGEWQQCNDGNRYTWDEAGSYCSSLLLNGKSDWRLPTADEYRRDGSCLVNDVYNDNYGYWTSDLSTSNPDEKALEYDMFGNILYPRSKSYKYRVRCVRRP